MVWPIDPNNPKPDHEYYAAVRASVESSVHSQLSDIDDRSELVGRWWHSFPTAQDREQKQYEYDDDGTLITPYDEVGKPSSQWRFESDVYIERTWCDPMPEYGIPDGTWNEEAYHCAKTQDGRIVLWNGDGSLIAMLTPNVG